MDEETELVCEECGAKLTGEEGVMVCWYCQAEEEDGLFHECLMDL